MRLAFDTVGARFGGTAVVARDVVAASLRCTDVDHVIVFATTRDERQFDFPSDPRLEVIERGRLASSAAARIAWQLAGLPGEARRRGVEVVIGLANGGVGGSIPTAVFIQQALPFAGDVLAREPVRMRARMRMVRELMAVSARRAVAVGVQTEAMRAAVVRGLHLAPERVHAFMPPAPQFPSPVGVERIEAVPRGRRVLYVCTELPYKNAGLARSAAERVGAVLFMTADTKETAHVVALPSLGRAELRAAYESCDALVMPSLCESLGLPLLEGMRLGIPIVAIDRPYTREVCGHAALYAENDADAMAEALRRVLSDQELRTTLVAAGRARIAHLDQGQAYETMVRTFVHAARLRGVE